MKLEPEQYNLAFKEIGSLKLCIRHYLDVERCKTPWEVQSNYHKLLGEIYKRWTQLHPYLLKDDSLMTQFFHIFEVLFYAHSRSKARHRAKVLDTRLPVDIKVGELIESVQALTNGVQDLPQDAKPVDLEPLQAHFTNCKGLRDLVGAAETAVEAYLDAKVAADYREFMASK